jgi:peptidoglycan-associated lipoprotein
MRRLPVLVLAALAATTFSACGPKRPPNLSTATPGSGADSPTSGVADDAASRAGLDTAGPDTQPLDSAGLAGEEIPSSLDATTEGGPLDDIYFDYDQHDLTEAAKATLAQHAQWLQARPGVRVMVEGHCDERGTTDYNLALGDKRARATREYLVGLGVEEGRLTAISLGKERPKDPGHDEQAWAKNRRAHFALAR